MLNGQLTDATEVREILDVLGAAGCRTWVAGGWGVDVLVCLSSELQLEFRRGYELRDVDRHDIALLRSLD